MGLEKKVVLILGIIAILSFISLASAQILVSVAKDSYSLGEEASFAIKIDAIKSGYMDVNLICSGSSANIYHNVPESASINIKRKLTQDYIENLSGACHVEAFYAEQEGSSANFEISNSLDLEITNIKSEIEAGNSITIEGTVYKKNGQMVGQIEKAYAVATIEGEIASATSSVKDSQFKAELLVPENTHAGRKIVRIGVYNIDESGNKLNSAEISREINVLQKIARLDVAVDKLAASPEENVTVLPILYDGAGDKREDKVSLKIIDSKQNSLFQGLVVSGVEFVYQIPANLSPGMIKVTAEKDKVNGNKFFEVKSLRKISTEIGNETVIIKNIGNVHYSGEVEIKIGSKSFLEEVELDVGQNAKYALSAPDGTYDVLIKDDSSYSSLETGVILTGSAVDLKKVGETTDYLFSRYPIVWIFLCIIIALFLYSSYKRYEKNRKFQGYAFNFRKDKDYMEFKRKGGVEVIKPEEINQQVDSILLKGDVRKAEQVVVMHGQKSQVSVIAIKLKSKLEGIANHSFRKALEYAYKSKAVSYNSGDYSLLIFSPLITKNAKNEETAIKIASEIDNYLKEHNRKFRNDKIIYGIGVNSGEIINKLDGVILQFANVGKTISTAKRIAEIASSEVLLSKEIHEKTPSVKTDKYTAGAIEAFRIKRIVNSEESAKFIKEFVKRN